MTSDVKLLPLPAMPRQVEGYASDYWTQDQIEDYATDYARACIEADRKARADGREAVARVELNGLSMSGLVWTEAGRKADLRDGTNLYTHPAPDDVARLVEAATRAASHLDDETAYPLRVAIEPFTATQQEVQS